MQASTAEQIARAYELLSQGKLDSAERLLKQILRTEPSVGQALYCLGLIDYQRQRFAKAAELIGKAIGRGVEDPTSYNNLGLALLAAGDAKKAIEAFDQALELDPLYVQAWFNRGNAWRERQNLQAALLDYEKALALDPYLALAHNNLGLVFRQNGDLSKAIDCFEKCLQVQPDYHLALNNLGLCHQMQGATNLALQNYHAALALAPNYVEAHVNTGNLLQQAGRYEEALVSYRAAYKLAPQLDFLLGHLVQCKAMLCDWQDYNVHWRQIEKRINQGSLPCTPFVMLSGCDDGKTALKLAKLYSDRHVQAPLVSPYQLKDRGESKKLRIGYFSSDFKEHPVAYLMVGIVENHDREAFEIIGFALSEPGSDPLGQRIRKAFDSFVDVSSIPDLQAIELIRSYDLDIAIDLNGYIDGCRPSIFKARVAPIQVNYYGYPGTMGASFMDYIVGDSYLMPAGAEVLYQEKILYLPESYQPNDDQRPIAGFVGSRADHGLPDEAFVFCCFNKPYKITPDVFSSWMQILAAVPKSVLWLQSTDETVRRNLRQSASKCGVEPDRLVFAGRVPTTSEHLARYRLADLFLDTYPYTAHTTANDALWVGLPVLGFSGETFSARVSESLLSALGLNDWVMRSISNYQVRAIELAKQPEQLADLRERLRQGKEVSSLYKPTQITRWLEKGLKSAHDKHVNGLAPEHIFVPVD
jgi:protein O-GlcNAc transferase